MSIVLDNELDLSPKGKEIRDKSYLLEVDHVNLANSKLTVRLAWYDSLGNFIKDLQPIVIQAGDLVDINANITAGDVGKKLLSQVFRLRTKQKVKTMKGWTGTVNET